MQHQRNPDVPMDVRQPIQIQPLLTLDHDVDVAHAHGQQIDACRINELGRSLRRSRLAAGGGRLKRACDAARQLADLGLDADAQCVSSGQAVTRLRSCIARWPTGRRGMHQVEAARIASGPSRRAGHSLKMTRRGPWPSGPPLRRAGHTIRAVRAGPARADPGG